MHFHYKSEGNHPGMMMQYGSVPNHQLNHYHYHHPHYNYAHSLYRPHSHFHHAHPRYWRRQHSPYYNYNGTYNNYNNNNNNNNADSKPNVHKTIASVLVSFFKVLYHTVKAIHEQTYDQNALQQPPAPQNPYVASGPSTRSSSRQSAQMPYPNLMRNFKIPKNFKVGGYLQFQGNDQQNNTEMKAAKYITN
jgi:hypothetical protein